MKNEDVKAKIIAKAWKDPKFKKKLIEHPEEAFREMGVNIPKNIKIKVVEDSEKSFTFVLPPTPEKLNLKIAH